MRRFIYIVFMNVLFVFNANAQMQFKLTSTFYADLNKCFEKAEKRAKENPFEEYDSKLIPYKKFDAYIFSSEIGPVTLMISFRNIIDAEKVRNAVIKKATKVYDGKEINMWWAGKFKQYVVGSYSYIMCNEIEKLDVSSYTLKLMVMYDDVDLLFE